MNLTPQNLKQVTLCYTLVIIYKPRNGLCIYKSRKLESKFINILNPKKTNVSLGYIYRRPHMDLNEFNDYYINNLLNKLSK